MLKLSKLAKIYWIYAIIEKRHWSKVFSLGNASANDILGPNFLSGKSFWDPHHYFRKGFKLLVTVLGMYAF